MCAIIDANVAHEVFGNDRPEAGVRFYSWLTSGIGRLVVGGKLLDELGKTSFRELARQLQLAGVIRVQNNDDVDRRAEDLSAAGACRSNDPHVLALAKISGARLLYSNDGALHQDFRNKDLIDQPRGRIYSTRQHRAYRTSHDQLLRRRDLCRMDP